MQRELVRWVLAFESPEPPVHPFSYSQRVVGHPFAIPCILANGDVPPTGFEIEDRVSDNRRWNHQNEKPKPD